jgi:peptidyl-prolyl cis-trans isomerase D
MLNVLRKQAGSWIVKALLLLLVVSFAMWGIGDVFFGSPQNPAVATVADNEITTDELANAFNRSVENLQQRIGAPIDREQAIQLGVMQQSLQDLIVGRLMALRARDMGLTVTDDALRDVVTSNPAFQSAGRFDRSRFEQLLRANGLTEEGYLTSLRQDVMRNTLADGLAAGAVVPQALVDAVYRFRNEQRSGRYMVIETASITDPLEPGDEDLQPFYDAHQDRFTAPEYRTLTFVTLEPEDLLGEVEVPEDKINAEYQDRLDTYRTPEHRTITQLLASDRETVDAALRRLQEGETMTEVGTAMADQGVVVDDLGSLTRNDLPDDLATAAFTQAEGEIGSPVESPFGWHLFEVSAIDPETVVPLADVRDDLAKQLALTEASDRLPGLATQLDDELAAGMGVAEAAAALGLTAKTVTVDVNGKAEDGTPSADLPAWPAFLETAFATPEGQVSLLEETDDGSYYVIETDSVAAPRLMPLDEVRDAVAAAWQAERRRELAQERAKSLIGRANEVASLDQLADGLEVTAIGPLKRNERGGTPPLSPAIVRALFATEPGVIAKDPVALPTGFAIVATDEVIEADPSADPDAVAQLRAQLEAETRNDLLTQFESALRSAYTVEINGAAINRLIDPNDLGGY